MILNHSKTIKVLYPYCAQDTIMEMHSRHITLLIVLLWYNIVHYSSLFQYFLSMCYGPYSSWKFQFFLFTCCKNEVGIYAIKVVKLEMNDDSWESPYFSTLAIVLLNAKVGTFPPSYAVIPSLISCFTTFHCIDPFKITIFKILVFLLPSKFEENQLKHPWIIAVFLSGTKRSTWRKMMNFFLKAHISVMAGQIQLKFQTRGAPTLREFTQQKCLISRQALSSYGCRKTAFPLFLYNAHLTVVCPHWLYLATQHTIMCLDPINYQKTVLYDISTIILYDTGRTLPHIVTFSAQLVVVLD